MEPYSAVTQHNLPPTHDPPDVTVVATESFEEWCDLGGAWRSLWESDPRATPFQSPAWLLNWWRCFGAGRLWVISIRNNGTLIGLLPCAIQRDADTGRRRVVLMGTGPSDYLDILLSPGEEAIAIPALARFLIEQSHEWDTCDFQELREDSPLLHLSLPAGWHDQHETQSTCLVLPLPGTIDEWHESLSPGFLHELRHAALRAESRGELIYEKASPQNFSELFHTLVDLHEQRCEETFGSGVGKDLSPLLYRAGSEMFAHDELELHGLRLGGNIIAATFGMRSRNSVYYFLGGFDPNQARISPGSLLLLHVIEASLQGGAKRFDFLRGDEPYKFRWGARGHPNQRRQFTHG